MFTLRRSNHMARLAVLLLVMMSFGSSAQDSRGFKFNNLNVSPYVNLEYTYDSNVDNDNKNALDDNIFRVNPGVDVSYSGNDWGLRGNGWFAYDKYQDQSQEHTDETSYGENLDFYRESPSGWKFVLGEKYLKSSQDDSLADGGRGLWRDRDQFDVNSALTYQFSEKTSATLSGQYSDLSYANDSSQYMPLYGWTEWSMGLELAQRITEKSNVLLDGSYQSYTSDGAKNSINSDSTGYTLQAGFSSAATKRITYRALSGVSWFDYAGGDQLQGWVYSLDASWVVNKKVALTVAGSSYFQPSEREQNQAMQVYTLSSGLTYRPMRRLTTRFDLAYRKEETQEDISSTSGRQMDQVSCRARADYTLRRYVTLYGGLEYETQTSDDVYNEFDKFRGTLGVNFRY